MFNKGDYVQCCGNIYPHLTGKIFKVFETCSDNSMIVAKTLAVDSSDFKKAVLEIKDVSNYNIDSAKTLVSMYKAITLEDIVKEWKRCDPYVDGFIVLYHFTGFGDPASCKLCEGARRLVDRMCTNIEAERCKHCVYSIYPTPLEYPILLYCSDYIYGEIEHSEAPEELYTLLQCRIEYLEDTINFIENNKI